MSDETARLTQLLHQWADGDLHARDEIIPIVYRTLHRLAAHYLRAEQRGHTLQPTALVHEAYLRLVDQRWHDWNSRHHFYSVAANLMRQVLVDHARRRLSQKRGGGALTVDLDSAAGVSAPVRSTEILALDEALEELARVDARKSQVLELRYFGGCTQGETAQALSLSPATVRRDLRAAEAWLSVQLQSSTTPPGQ